jgi:hypothetical protein
VSELYQMIQPTLQVLRQFLVRNWEIKQNVSLALSAINQLTISDQADQKSIDTRAGLEECANDIFNGIYPEEVYFKILKGFVRNGVYTKEDLEYIKTHLEYLKKQGWLVQLGTHET